MYRIITGDEVRCFRGDKEEYEVERLGNIVHEYFPELTRNFYLPEQRSAGGYIFCFFIDKESGMPVAIGCDDLKYIPAINKIEPVPDSLTLSPVFNEDELIEQCTHLRKRYHEILKELKITDIKKAGAKYELV